MISVSIASSFANVTKEAVSSSTVNGNANRTYRRDTLSVANHERNVTTPVKRLAAVIDVGTMDSKRPKLEGNRMRYLIGTPIAANTHRKRTTRRCSNPSRSIRERWRHTVVIHE